MGGCAKRTKGSHRCRKDGGEGCAVDVVVHRDAKEAERDKDKFASLWCLHEAKKRDCVCVGNELVHIDILDS